MEHVVPSSSAPRALRGEALRAALGDRRRPARPVEAPLPALPSRPPPVPSTPPAPVADAEPPIDVVFDDDDEDTGPPALRPHELARRLERLR